MENKNTWFGHPVQLARLFTVEMWERFGFYGMRALLTLYLTNHFIFSDTTTTAVYGGFTALVYLTPLIGGFLADRYLGAKRSVKFGALLMSIGYFILCFGGKPSDAYIKSAGQEYPVIFEEQVNDKNEKVRKKYVILDGKKLSLKGNEDNSLSFIDADGKEAKRFAKENFESSAHRSFFHIAIMLIGLSVVTMGNGFFKPNISTIVGSLYATGDSRKDAGFTIFYMGINLGSLLSQLFCPYLAENYGFWFGFGLAAIGMLVSLILVCFDNGRLAGYGERPEGVTGSKDLLIFGCSILAIPLIWLLFYNLMDYVKPAAGKGFVDYLLNLPIMGKMLFCTFFLSVPLTLIWSYKNGSKKEFEMMIAAMMLIVFNVVFWTLFEQAGSSLTLFAERNTVLSFMGYKITAGQTQFFNAAFIVIFAPIFSYMWRALAKKGLEPSIPIKFSIALAGVGLGFLLLVYGSKFVNEEFKVGLWWLVGLYLIHSLAELCISPVGLSMITKLSIVRIVGMMMGVWFLSISMAQFVAGLVAQMASIETVAGEVTNAKTSLDTYIEVFKQIGYVSIGFAVALFIVSFVLKKLMHGVK
jgi:proton-dependent oligopeptide transporter, POT family